MFLTNAILSCILMIAATSATIYDQIQNERDLQQWTALSRQHDPIRLQQESDEGEFTIFAPVDTVFNQTGLSYITTLDHIAIDWALDHIVSRPLHEITTNKRWNETLIVTSANEGARNYIVQKVNGAGNYTYFINNGRLCNPTDTANSQLTSGNSMLFKLCTHMGQPSFTGNAVDFIRADTSRFRHLPYDNTDLRSGLAKVLTYFSTVVAVLFNQGSAESSFRTFFLPKLESTLQFHSRINVNHSTVYAMATGDGVILFTDPWLFDHGIPIVNTVELKRNYELVENNLVQLSIRNLVEESSNDRNLYVKAMVLEHHNGLKKGAVWAKIVTPNIPVSNGVVHIVDRVFGVVTESILEMLMNDIKFRLNDLISTIGSLVKNELGKNNGKMTFFAPTNKAFERLPTEIRKKLQSDYYWLLQIVKMHIVPQYEFTTDQIGDATMINSQTGTLLFLSKDESSKNYFVRAGGIRARIIQEDIAATNGIMHSIDHILGVPYEILADVIMDNTETRISWDTISRTNVRYALNESKMKDSDTKFTVFLPTDGAWEKLSPSLLEKLRNGSHDRQLEFVLKRHIIVGRDLTSEDLRERTYITLNKEKIIVRRMGRHWQLYWPYARMAAIIIEGGGLAATNGYTHLIDEVLVLEEDLNLRYHSIRKVIQDETNARMTWSAIEMTNLSQLLDSSNGTRGQNFTVFLPTDSAWQKLDPELREQLFDVNHIDALRKVMERHISQAEFNPSDLNDLNELTMMNNEIIEVKELNKGHLSGQWSNYLTYHGKRTNLIDGGNIEASNGYVYLVDTVLVDSEDIKFGTDAKTPFMLCIKKLAGPELRIIVVKQNGDKRPVMQYNGGVVYLISTRDMMTQYQSLYS